MPTELPDRLREALAETHRRIEQLPYAQAIMNGSIGRDAYVASLSQFVAVHEGLEAALDRHPELPCYVASTMSRTETLRRDLSFWGIDAPDSPRPEAGRLASMFERWSDAAPWSLLGAVYVFEGSRMGSMFLAKSIGRALGVAPTPGNGLDYHAEGMTTRPRDWAAFRESLRSAPLDEAQARDVVDAASATFDALYDLYQVLDVERGALAPMELAS